LQNGGRLGLVYDTHDAKPDLKRPSQRLR